MREAAPPPPAMGGSQSVEIPGGGTEGYHVLRVRAAGRRAGVPVPFRLAAALGPGGLSLRGPALQRPEGLPRPCGPAGLPTRRQALGQRLRGWRRR